MRISYLILAHNNYQHLARLVDRLMDDKESHVYIHIDGKRPLPAHIIETERLRVINERIDIYWGGYSSIRATLALMRAAQEDGNGEYCALISGTDYPIHPPSMLHAQLAQGGEFINLLQQHKSKRLSRYRYYHFEGPDRRNPYSLKTLGYWLVEYSLRLVAHKRFPFPLFVGSTWWVLSRDCIAYILNTVDTDSRFEHFFKYSLCADECFFQTIIGNSDFLAHVRPNLTYTDWSTKPAPALITEKHLDYLKANPTIDGLYGTFSPYFARKFDDHSAETIKLIDREFLKK